MFVNRVWYGIGVLILLAVGVYWSMNHWSAPIIRTLEEDDNQECLKTIWSIRGFKSWYRLQKLRTILGIRRLKSVILVRIYSSNTLFWKGLVAITLSSVGFLEAESSPVLTGATVFYATMIFLQSGFEYASLWSQSYTIGRWNREGLTDGLGVSTSVRNLGTKPAEGIEAELLVIDPIRGLRGKANPDEPNNSSVTTKIEPKRSASYSFTFSGKGDTMQMVQHRASMKGVLGQVSFIIVVIRAQNMPTEVIQYKNVSTVEGRSLDKLSENISDYLPSIFGTFNKYTEEELRESQSNE